MTEYPLGKIQIEVVPDVDLSTDSAKERFFCGHCNTGESYGHRPSHRYNAATEDIGFSSTRQTLPATSAKRREVLGESHEGLPASY